VGRLRLLLCIAQLLLQVGSELLLLLKLGLQAQAKASRASEAGSL
jgi:hypothetical protein